MKWKFWKKPKKPSVVNVMRNWSEKGKECWSVAPEDFDRMFGGEYVISLPDDRICATSVFAGQPVIIYRGEKKE